MTFATIRRIPDDYMGTTVIIAIRLRPEVVRRVDKKAKAENRSRAGMIAELVRRGLKRPTKWHAPLR